MPFTDDDMKYWKNNPGIIYPNAINPICPIFKHTLAALIARLEAAEAIERNHFADCRCSCEGLDGLRKAWRAASGKS